MEAIVWEAKRHLSEEEARVVIVSEFWIAGYEAVVLLFPFDKNEKHTQLKSSSPTWSLQVSDDKGPCVELPQRTTG
jgi:hypothetical protein